MTMGRFAVAAIAFIALVSSESARAQKSKDTLRLVTEEPFSHLDHYHAGGNQVGFLARAVYGRLFLYNEHTGNFIPELAKAWKRVNATTLELDLRDDIQFHSGNKFSPMM